MKFYNFIKTVIIFLSLPYLVLFDTVFGGGYGKNSGHTAGLGEGFMLLGAIISAISQVVLLAGFFLGWFVLS